MDQFLVDHVNKGWSYLEVAKAVRQEFPHVERITRNAVAGRKYRLINRGWEIKKPDHMSAVTHANKQRVVKAKKEKESRPVKKPDKPASPLAQVIRLRNPATGQLKPVRPGVLPMTPNAKTITELGRHQCRAAVGEGPRMHDGINNPFLFCGARTEEGEAYCTEHAALMYTAPKARTERGFLLGRIGTNKGAA